MAYQVDRWRARLNQRAEPQTTSSQWCFINIYQAILNTRNLDEHEILVLSRLLEKRLAAYRQRRRGITAIKTS